MTDWSNASNPKQQHLGFLKMESDLILQDLFQNISKNSITEKAGSKSPSVSKKSSKRKKKRDIISEDSCSSGKGMEEMKSKKKKKCKGKSNNDSDQDSDIKLKKKKSKKSKRSHRSRPRSDDESNESYKRDFKQVTKCKEDFVVKDQSSLIQVKEQANRLDVKELDSTMIDIPLPRGVVTSSINTIPLPSSCNSLLKEEKTETMEDDKSTGQSLSDSQKSIDDVNIADAFGVLLSKVIEEVDAENRLKENYESGEISSDNAEKSPSSGKSKKKKLKKNKSSKEGKKKRRSLSSSHGKRDTQIDTNSSSSKCHKERSRSPERNKHHDKAVSKHHKSRSRSPRHSDRYCHNSRDYSSRGDSRRSDRRRSRSRDRKHSSEHYSRHSRSPDRRYRDRRSSDRPFRVAPPRRSSRDRSRSTSPRFDKAKLLSIARQNLEKMKSAGILPENVTQNEVWRTIQAGGKTVKDLTDFCQRLAQASYESDSSSSNKDDIRHPFQVKVPAPEKASGVFQFNIKNAITLPVRNADEIKQSANKLKEQFPVSSGTVHRKQVGEDEWVPVVKENEPKVMHHPKVTISDAGHRMVANQLGIKQETKPKQTNAVAPIPRTQEQPQASSISELVAKRIAAMKRFQDNPNDFVAKKELEDVEAQTRQWVYRKEREFEVNKPPNFIDFSTAPQSWASKAQFANAAPVTSGPGLKLLQKMGWQQGEGLGRNKDGTLEPLTLDIKMDKKGLVSREEVKPCRLPITKAAKSISGKHPVTSLNEICVKRRLPMPHFEQIFEAGPDHLKQFLFKVTVNNIEYRPVMASSTKKEAKAQCAAVCLQALGLLPT